MKPRRLTPTTILTDAEVQALAFAVQEYFGEWFGPFGRSLDAENVIRLSSLGKQCQARREQTGLSIAETARALRVPQYRLKAIEAGHMSRIEGPVLRAYLAHLGLEAWYERWRRANARLAKKLAMTEADDQGAAAGARRHGKHSNATRR